MSMEIVCARRDSLEANVMNANQISLGTSVTCVKKPSIIIHPARTATVILMDLPLWNVTMSMEIVRARRDSLEANVMNANQILLGTSVTYVMRPFIIIHPARIVNVSHMVPLHWNVVTKVIALAKMDMLARNVMILVRFISKEIKALGL